MMSSNSIAAEEAAAVPFEHFKSKSYDKALEALTPVIKLKEKEKIFDPKVQHNLSVVNYHLNGCSEPKKFIEELAKIKKKMEDTTNEQDAASAANNGTTPNSNSTPPSASSSSSSTFEDSDASLLGYNQAVVNLQLKQYATALATLETLFQNIEPLDEYLAVRVCFLLLDVYLILKQKDKASSVITYLEKSFPALANDAPVSAERDAENQRRTCGISSSNVPAASSLTANATSQSNPIMSAQEFRYHFHLAKAKLHLLSKNLKPSKKEIKLALGTGQNLTSLFLKANLEYLRSNFAKAIQLLLSAHSKVTDEDHAAVLYFNNVGCIHYKMKKYSAANFYFTKSLRLNELLLESPDSKKLSFFSKNRKMEILYNTGCQLLLTGKPEQAFQCFQQSTLLLYKQPKVWIRLAECCIALHAKKLADANKENKNHLVRKAAGSGETKRVVLPAAGPYRGLKLREEPDSSEEPVDYTNAPAYTAAQQISGQKPAAAPAQFGSISLEFGAKCTRNALFLLSRSLATNATEEDQAMRLTALADAAYIALAGNNPVVALFYARELVQSAKVTEAHRHLGNLYAAEALCMLGKPNEAAQHLNPANLGSGEVAAGAQSSPYTSLMPDAAAALNPRYTLYTNLAVVFILKDDLLQAQKCLNQALSISRSATAVLLQVYLELRNGNTEQALLLLKSNGASFAPKLE
eukprot:TRINITY_DN9544_c0_g1_i1.p1 TRINITY_DN9544_c0_g1~~TRINITY_DN9544_c0_g1_i1.p1  ORF type:complete len:693 (+),score=200.67 TRINITY_DN9544_c0_g1_i1:213-2291(+)